MKLTPKFISPGLHFSQMLVFSAAWYLKHPPILYHLVPPSLWSSTVMGEAFLGMGAHVGKKTWYFCETRDQEPSSLSPSDGNSGRRELHCVKCSGCVHFVHEGSCSGGKEEKLEPKQRIFKPPRDPRLNNKQGLPDTATAWQKQEIFGLWHGLAWLTCLSPIDSHPVRGASCILLHLS